MINHKKFLFVCMSLALISCASPSQKSLIKQSSPDTTGTTDRLPPPELSSSINSLKNSILNKKPGYHGTKPVNAPDTGFYENISSCNEGAFRLRDLPVEDVRVSNHQLSTVSNSLSAMGYRVINLQTPDFDPFASFSCDELPVIVIQSTPQKLKLSFTDNSISDNSQYEMASSGSVSDMGSSNAGELDSFLVYYHPEQRSELNKLKWLVSHKLDAPSSQVYIETMVLEVREEDSKEFGLNFQKADGDKLLSLGALETGSSTIEWMKNTIIDPDSGLQIFTPGIGKKLQLKALIDEGKAEVLSRPSVLAVSNRQAIIQIVDVIQTPELSSSLSQSGNLEISSYSFSPLLIGITLNLKPRVSADRQWLTLEIDATVESEDDENSGQVFAISDSGESVLLAEKQGSSSKKVRTFARIPDRTPIIIGGLVSKAVEKRESKIPFLGDIPFIGKLFTSMDDEIQKREIIIVLTPYILDEEGIGIASNQPASHITGRLSDSMLFEQKYRLKNDDLFDLTFFDRDELFSLYRDKAIRMALDNPELRTQAPVKDFIQNTIPGSNHLINKMVFDIVANAELSSRIKEDQIVFADKQGADDTLESAIDNADDFTGGKQIQISLSDTGVTYQSAKGTREPTPEIYQIAITNLSDAARLKAALIAKDIIALNGGYDNLSLKGLFPGKELKLPKYNKAEQVHVSKEVMDIYLDSRHYYQSVLRRIDESYKKLDNL